MKTLCSFLILCLICANVSFGQTQSMSAPGEDTSDDVLHISKDDFPKGNPVNYIKDWGGMVVAINEAPKGADFTPVFKGQKDGLCQVPHWGYLEKGKVKLVHKDQSFEIVNAGEVFYMPPGHTAIVEEDSRFIDFSPQTEMLALIADINKIMAEEKH
ncbi:hypothetical protein [Formosa sp. S-31]|uniref:hypothetical protein n=1 Tax=Formosa sp. S-31 TaxID=2790949 RepID=UPI003EB6B74E